MAGVQQPMYVLACVQGAEPRNALYMAALTAIRRNPPLAAFYKRLRDCGKQPKLALVAVMRKLVALADAPPLRERPLAGLLTLRTGARMEPPPFQPFMEITLDFQHGCSSLVGKDSSHEVHEPRARMTAEAKRSRHPRESRSECDRRVDPKDAPWASPNRQTTPLASCALVLTPSLDLGPRSLSHANRFFQNAG